MNTIEDAINHMIKHGGVDTNKISDGYHTFGELYEHRITVFIALCAQLSSLPGDYRAPLHSQVWRSKLHSDGSNFDGWFVLGVGKEKGHQITYHLPMGKWHDTEFAEDLERAPEFDGHTSADVLTRLKSL